MEVLWLGHTGTMFRYGEIIVCIDPFLSNSFFWHGVEEQYQGQSPWIQKPNKRWDLIMQYAHQIHAICITHAHGDHCDLPTLVAMKRLNPNIQIIAPLNVIQWLKVSESFANPTLVAVRRGSHFTIHAKTDTLEIDYLPDPHFPFWFYPKRVGYVIYAQKGIGIAQLGDSHGPTSTWKKYRAYVSDIFTWMREKPAKLLQYFDPTVVRHIWWIHWETFRPGHFDCNIDPQPKIIDPQYPKGMMRTPSYDDWISLSDSPN